MAEDDGAVTLRDIAQRLDGVSDRLAGLDGRVTTALESGARVMDDLRSEIRLIRSDREDDRQRLTRAEDDIRDLQRDREATHTDRRDRRWWVASSIVTALGWIVSLWHPWTRAGQ